MADSHTRPRIVVHRCINGTYPTLQAPAGTPVCSAGSAMAEEAPDDGPAPAADAGADRPAGGDGGPAGPPVPPALLPALAVPGEGDANDEYAEPRPAADMHDWLVHNWQAIKALEAAGKLPDLELMLRRDEESGEDAEAAAAPAPAAEPECLERPFVAPGDRWTKPKMADFLRHLAATHSVTAAARGVGMSRKSAYKLRARLKGQPFDIAWEAAFRHGYDNLAHAALDRAINGVEVPHYRNGVLVGTSRRFDERLTVALLMMRNRAGAPMLGRFGAVAEYSSERWDALLARVETGAVDWSDERSALGAREVSRIVPDAEREAELLIERNMPDDGPARRRRA